MFARAYKPTWTVTYTGGDCSSAGTYYAWNRDGALDAYARDEGFANFGAYCSARKRDTADFEAVPDTSPRWY